MLKLSYNIKIYREQLLNLIKEDDVIIELGCHVGGTSKLILNKLNEGRLIALDNSPEAIAKMNKLSDKYDNLDFISGDVRLHNIISEVYSKIPKCDILSVDLGGGYHPDTTFKVFYIWASTFKPKHTLIRNKGLVDFKNSAICQEDISSNLGYLESYNDEGIPPQIKEFDLWTSALDNK